MDVEVFDVIVLGTSITRAVQGLQGESLYLMNPRPSSQKAGYPETPCNAHQFKVYPHVHF
jgi:hypothetical protein